MKKSLGIVFMLLTLAACGESLEVRFDKALDESLERERKNPTSPTALETFLKLKKLSKHATDEERRVLLKSFEEFKKAESDYAALIAKGPPKK